MRIDNIQPLLSQTIPQSVEYSAKPSFTSWLGEQVLDTNKQLTAADQALTDLATGHSQNLHATMLVMEQAKLSFQFLEQIRNRVLSAYQEILREQI